MAIDSWFTYMKKRVIFQIVQLPEGKPWIIGGSSSTPCHHFLDYGWYHKNGKHIPKNDGKIHHVYSWENSLFSTGSCSIVIPVILNEHPQPLQRPIFHVRSTLETLDYPWALVNEVPWKSMKIWVILTTIRFFEVLKLCTGYLLIVMDIYFYCDNLM